MSVVSKNPFDLLGGAYQNHAKIRGLPTKTATQR
jgi:hypothetical protein